MLKYNCICFTLVCVLCSALSAAAFHPPSRLKSFTRISLAPGYGFYFLRTKHATSPQSRLSFALAAKQEWSVDRAHKTFFSAGLEYFLHGVSYNSYYFTQDTLQIYSGEFDYRYRLFVHELQLPLQMKFCFNSTTNSLFSPYVSIGYHLRYLLSSQLHVDGETSKVKNGFPELIFRNPFLLSRMNSSPGLCFGIQSNPAWSGSTSFFAELMYRHGFSPYYFNEPYAARSVFINSGHILLNLGIGF
jgi:hypothetical protein